MVGNFMAIEWTEADTDLVQTTDRHPHIVLQPMTQRSEVRKKGEDWTGKNSTALRRKLQNRLNKRASRRRKQDVAQATAINPIQLPADIDSHRIASNPIPDNIQLAIEIARRPFGNLPPFCIQSAMRHRISNAPSFAQYLEITIPLPVDQKLLTLLHFNLVRALTCLVGLLRVDMDRMHDDLESPWTANEECHGFKPEGRLEIEDVPEMMRPTSLQRGVRHHPEADILPFPEYRDNLILAGDEIDDVELCMDFIYGVEEEAGQGGCGEGRTGMIVWDDPWLQSSWEVEERFARKWGRLMKGCGGLIESSNFWRKSRGERPLRVDW